MSSPDIWPSVRNSRHKGGHRVLLLHGLIGGPEKFNRGQRKAGVVGESEGAMKTKFLTSLVGRVVLGLGIPAPWVTGSFAQSDPLPVTPVKWTTVVNNLDVIPATTVNFNSYNQPSMNASGLVVFRARSKGPNTPVSGVFMRNLNPASAITNIALRGTEVPFPNNTTYPPDNTLAAYNEFPSIPRVAMHSAVIATRGNSEPVWTYTVADSETKVGTNGIYVFSSGNATTGASLLGAVPPPSDAQIGKNYFPYFAVPGASEGTRFDVFPGSPSITDEQTIVFKGNYTDGDVSKTGVYFRSLTAMGGYASVELIANSDTLIPNLPSGISGIKFGSTAPPTATGDSMVFTGYDNEDAPTYGGIYQAQLVSNPVLKTLVGIGMEVPGLPGQTFTGFGEGLAYDGRYVAFWGSWGTEKKLLWLDCPTDGNKDLIAYCKEFVGDNFPVEVPVNQGIFVHDTVTGETWMVASTGANFDDFLFWTFSGRPPGTGSGDESDDSEPPRWRSSAYLAVSSALDSGVTVAFKARTGEVDPVEHSYINPVDGIYLGSQSGLSTLLDTTMDGQTLDPQAPVGSKITALGIEREGLRGTYLGVSATMSVAATSESEEVESLAGIYAVNFAKPADSAVHGVTVAASRSKPRNVVFHIRNSGNVRATFTLHKNTRVASPGRPSTPPPPDRKSPIVVTYHMGNANITKALERGHASITLDPGQTGHVVAKVRVLRPLSLRRVIYLTMRATSQSQASASHSASIKVILPATQTKN